MKKPRVGIVGRGVVGCAVENLCDALNPVVYDPNIPGLGESPGLINTCDVVFVCVPTPMKDDGSCDTSIVEEVVAWIEAPLIIIRSTVEPGTTDRLREKYDKHIVFQPEYLGETVGHPFKDMADRGFVVLGGQPSDTSRAVDFYKHVYNSTVRFYLCDSVTAEVAKYMENSFFAVKVTFCNEFYDIAKAHGIDFNTVREVWLADPRISRDHTFVYPEDRGFGGKCLPKDVNAIVKSSELYGYTPRLLKACLKINDDFRR